MNRELRTFIGDETKATCLICNTSYYNGNPIIPQPSCDCGNIPYFDITPAYVRFAINFPLVTVSNLDNWQIEILGQIKNYGHPLHYRNLKDDKHHLDLNQYLNSTKKG
ncbi:hypothetical protein PXC01_05700 [Maribacter sp. M208]|uniref:hypothetical protein n=1 Tax=Maribacter huludaoensis TaxID=3030010 RepID=UPI0023EBE56C|nr:hypothetical protein [Maribacter huludaoensis]MDF4221073.1 hypothetical protein [Maribacter huludaoensis]